MNTRTKIFLVIFLVAALFLVACNRYQYQVKTSFPGDEAWVMSVCSPSNKDCKLETPAVPVPETGNKMPPVGAWCKVIDVPNNILDCGSKYARVKLLIPPN